METGPSAIYKRSGAERKDVQGKDKKTRQRDVLNSLSLRDVDKSIN